VVGLTLLYAKPYHVNHILATVGLLLILIDYFGRRRVWLAAVGLLLAALSRQLTVAFALPIAVMAIQRDAATPRARRIVIAMLTFAVLGVGYCGLNVAKFGHPLRTGYMLNHEGRNDVFAREAREHGLLSLHWVGRNLYFTNVGLPEVHSVEVAGEQSVYLKPNTKGAGIWWTTPLLLLLLVDLPRLLRDRAALALLVAAAVVYGTMMFWHATGEYQRGYNRYSLDYLPVMFALIAPGSMMGGRRLATVMMIAWGVAYFTVLLPMPHLQVWSS
jgi:hypothetical protein